MVVKVKGIYRRDVELVADDLVKMAEETALQDGNTSDIHVLLKAARFLKELAVQNFVKEA